VAIQKATKIQVNNEQNALTSRLRQKLTKKTCQEQRGEQEPANR